MGLGRKGCFEEWGTDGHQSERGTHIHTHAPTHMHTKKGPVLKTASSPGCTPYATVADNLLSRLILRNAHKQMLVHARKSFLFFNCATFTAQRSFLAYWCAIVFMWAAKIRIYQLIEMPGGVSSPTHGATSVHTYPKSNTGNHKQPGIHTLRRTRSSGCDEQRKLHLLSILHYVKPSTVTAAFRLLPFHIWLNPIRTLNKLLKSNDATPTVTT